uniref:Uncharacterized protein n=1 Tax=Arundo donax TaxID=35708 RepID=A0A0A8Z0N3_ARUDO
MVFPLTCKVHHKRHHSRLIARTDYARMYALPKIGLDKEKYHEKTRSN